VALPPFREAARLTQTTHLLTYKEMPSPVACDEVVDRVSGLSDACRIETQNRAITLTQELPFAEADEGIPDDDDVVDNLDAGPAARPGPALW